MLGVLLPGQLLSPRAHGLRQVLKRGFCVFHADAGVGNTDAVLETGFALGGDLLVACDELAFHAQELYSHSAGPTLVNVTLDHHAHDGSLTSGHLLR